MASAFAIAILGAFATKASSPSPLIAPGYIASAGTCVLNQTVKCHVGSGVNCTISGITYFSNTDCGSLVKD
jgi:hypothetical protein